MAAAIIRCAICPHLFWLPSSIIYDTLCGCVCRHLGLASEPKQLPLGLRRILLTSSCHRTLPPTPVAKALRRYSALSESRGYAEIAEGAGAGQRQRQRQRQLAAEEQRHRSLMTLNFESRDASQSNRKWPDAHHF